MGMSLSVGMTILTVILTVLKWILFILLGIIGVILLILLIVLFTTLHYKVEANKEGEEIKAKVRANLFLHAIRIKADYLDKKLVWSVKLFAKQMAGNAPVKEKKKRRKKAPLKEKTKKEELIELSDTPKTSSEKMSEALPEKNNVSETVLPETQASLQKKAPDRSEETKLSTTETSAGAPETLAPAKKDQLTITERAEKQYEKIVSARDKKAAKAEKKKKRAEKKLKRAEGKQKLAEEKRRAKEKKTQDPPKIKKTLADRIEWVVDKLEKVWDFMLDLLDKILDAPTRIEEIVEEKTKPLKKLQAIWNRVPDKGGLLKDLFRIIRVWLKVILPRRGAIEVEFGTGDPAGTGQIMEYFYAFGPLLLPKQTKRSHLWLDGDYEEKRLDATVNAAGHFCIASFIGPLITALTSKRVRRVIHLALDLRKKKKTEETLPQKKETTDVNCEHE